MNKTVLVIDTDESFIGNLRRELIHDDFDVLVATDGLAGLQAARDQKPDFILANTELPRCNGWIVCRMLKFDTNTQNLNIVLMAQTDAELALSKTVGATDLWLRSMPIPAIVDRITRILGLPQIVRPVNYVYEDAESDLRPSPSLAEISQMEHKHA